MGVLYSTITDIDRSLLTNKTIDDMYISDWTPRGCPIISREYSGMSITKNFIDFVMHHDLNKLYELDFILKHDSTDYKNITICSYLTKSHLIVRSVKNINLYSIWFESASTRFENCKNINIYADMFSCTPNSIEAENLEDYISNLNHIIENKCLGWEGVHLECNKILLNMDYDITGYDEFLKKIYNILRNNENLFKNQQCIIINIMGNIHYGNRVTMIYKSKEEAISTYKGFFLGRTVQNDDIEMTHETKLNNTWSAAIFNYKVLKNIHFDPHEVIDYIKDYNFDSLNHSI